MKAVSDPADRLDPAGVPSQFLAQGLHVHVDRSFEHVGVVTHGRFHEVGTREGPAGLADQGP